MVLAVTWQWLGATLIMVQKEKESGTGLKQKYITIVYFLITFNIFSKYLFQKSLAKIQNGGQDLDMVRPTLFLLEIIQKCFILSLSFHILGSRNNNFCHPGGSQKVPKGLLACFKA